MRFYLRAISYFHDDWGKILLSLLMILISTGAGLLLAYPLAIFLDAIIGHVPPTKWDWIYQGFFAVAPSGKVGQIIALAVFALLLRIIQEGVKLCQTLLNVYIGYNGLMRVRCELFRKLQELSLAYHKSQPQGDAIYRLSYDTFGFQTVLNVLVQTVLVSVVTLGIMMWIMFSKSWKLTLVALSVAPLLFWTTKIYARILKTKSIQAKEVETELTTSIQRSVATVGLVQAFGREAEEYARFHNTVRNSIAAYLRLHWQEVFYWLFVGSIFGLGAAMILGYGGYLVYSGQMEVGALTIFLTYFVGQLYDPLNKLSSSAAAIQGGVAGVERVFEVMDRDPVIKDAPNAVALPRKPRVLELDHVGFAYRPGGSAVLKEVTCRIEPGQMVAFVGSSGVGKTTLLNLLPRFYDPTEGAIKLDGHDLRQIKVKDLRKHIALVLQENMVLPASVAENIAYGRPDATDAQIRAAAEEAGAAAFIEKMDNAYHSQISESGQNLSGGQKQRISIARALLTEAPIIIMDEPTSALDARHEEQIVQTLRRLRGTRTIILVSHRLSTVAECDQIFVMEEGQIIERGTHDALIARGGLYYEMARHQMKVPQMLKT